MSILYVLSEGEYDLNLSGLEDYPSRESIDIPEEDPDKSTNKSFY